jgi:xanthine dehydrogenase small subunit
VTTVDGLDPTVRSRLVASFVAAGASQCGFCTPGILCRLAGLGAAPSVPAVEQALLAHLCRCTGWRTIIEASIGSEPSDGAIERDLEQAAVRAGLEGGVPQRVGPDVVVGRGGFADDTAPAGSLVAVPADGGTWAVGETVADARAAAGKVQGRRSGRVVTWPLDVPPGDWARTLRTTWVEPAYLEPDASWCVPGGQPASPLANGGAFGAKLASPVAAAARRLADHHGRPVRVVWSREDVVRLGPKRPPVAAGVRADGTGVIRVVRTAGIAEAIASVAPGLEVEEVDVTGPPTSAAIRGAGWAEAAVLLAALTGTPEVTVTAPGGGRATALVTVDDQGAPLRVAVRVAAGDPLDEVVLRSYAMGAAHMALGWVCSEAVAIGEDGVPEDLTIRSLGILRARDTPEVDVTIDPSAGPPVGAGDAVFAAVAAATWLAQGAPTDWPTRRGVR